jgi:hypothetical protein
MTIQKSLAFIRDNIGTRNMDSTSFYQAADKVIDFMQKMISSMTIPNSQTCEDCKYYEWCCEMYGVKKENTTCDFHPIRFVGKQ